MGVSTQQTRSSRVVPADITGYTIIAVAVTWLLVAPLALWGLGASDTEPPATWHVLGAIGPTVGAVVMTWRRQGREGLVMLWRRASDPHRVRGIWWLMALSPLVLGIAAVMLAAPLDGVTAPDSVARSRPVEDPHRASFSLVMRNRPSPLMSMSVMASPVSVKRSSPEPASHAVIVSSSAAAANSRAVATRSPFGERLEAHAIDLI